MAAPTVLTGSSAAYTSDEPEGLISARNSRPGAFMNGATPSETGKSGDSVFPETQTLPAGSTVRVRAPSTPAPPKNVAHTIALPVGFSLATNASVATEGGTAAVGVASAGCSAEGVTGKLGSVVEPARYALPAASAAMAYTRLLGFATSTTPPGGGLAASSNSVTYASAVPAAFTLATKAPRPVLFIAPGVVGNPNPFVFPAR